MTSFVLQWKIDEKNAGKLVREFLREQQISKTALTDIKFKGGRIAVNGQEVTVRYLLQKGDHLVVTFPAEEPSEGIIAENLPLDIIYEDKYLLVLLKPAGMNTIPSREHPRGSLANALIGFYERVGLQSTVHIVTRLDRDTSGIVLVAKHRYIHHLLSEEQKAGRIKRVYEAFAEGVFTEERGTIEAPIGRKEDSIIERVVRADGQAAITHFTVKKQLPDFAWIELEPETGRTHQIRVHLAYIGHPLLGDELYGGSCQRIKRQALHCGQISFYHPISKQEVSFTAPLFHDMEQLLKESLHSCE